MLTTLDKFGRVTIPKKIRDHLGLQAGSILEIQQIDHNILIKIHDEKPKLKKEGSFLVFLGTPLGDLENTLEELRRK